MLSFLEERKRLVISRNLLSEEEVLNNGEESEKIEISFNEVLSSIGLRGFIKKNVLFQLCKHTYISVVLCSFYIVLNLPYI